MIDLGTVQPGSTIRIPFSTFNTAGAAVTMTNYAAADILIYKDGSTTERASTSGFTATTDFDGKTGKHLAVIDLSDNTTADFFAAGSEYLVAIDSVTVDSQTVGAFIGRFKIGYREAILNTTIATLASQTSFTLAAGPTDDNALVGCPVIIHDAASAIQIAIGVVSAYTGSTKTVTLKLDPAVFTMAAKDNVSFFMPSYLGLQQNGVTFTGKNASGSTPATSGLTLIGGDASTTSGGTSAPGLKSTGGSGAASTNAPQAGAHFLGGTAAGASGTSAAGVRMQGTDLGAGLQLTSAARNAMSFSPGSGYYGMAGGNISCNLLGYVLYVYTNNIQSNVGNVISATANTVSVSFGFGANDVPIGQEIRITSGTGIYQSRTITDWNEATFTATIDRDWAVTPTNGDNAETYYANQPALDSSLNPVAASVAGQTLANLDAAVSTRAPSATALSTTQWTNARAGYLDNLNVGGAVASNADINALNQSASRRITIVTVPQYERPESGTSSYTIEIRTYDGDGAAVNADTTPTITPTGIVSGSLAANLSAVSNPATGVYRATYSVTSGATVEQIRFDASANISSSTFTIAAYSQVTDLVSTTWNSSDASHLTSIFNKLPSSTYLAGSEVQAGVDAAIAAVNALATAIKAKTDNLPSDPADASDIASAFATLTTYVDTVEASLALIKAKTDLVGTSGVLAASAIDASTLTTAAANKLADITIRRSMASVETSSFGDTLSVDSLYGVSQRSAHSDTTTNAGKITVFKTDDTTQLGTITITSTPTGEVITSAKAD